MDTPGERPAPVPGTTWRQSDRPVPRLVVRPLLRFMVTLPAPAAAMTLAAAVALLWANSPWYSSYETLWSAEVFVHIGHLPQLDLNLREVVNDAGMSLFFLLVGVELRYEIRYGHLRKLSAAILPTVAALGGMVLPALLYVALNAGHPGARGWGIPVATDVAFAVGVVALVASRVAPGARVFLLTLAIVDDIGGIVVISVFYSSHLDVRWLLGVAGCVVGVLVLRAVEIRSLVPYVALGITAWIMLHDAGVEPAVVGVIFGLLTPLVPFHQPEAFGPEARRRARVAEQLMAEGPERGEEATTALLGLADLALVAAPPGPRLEQRLRIWVNLAILPLFALANAGVHIGGVRLDARIFFGTLIGLCVGKAVGVVAATLGTSKAAGVPFPEGLTFRSLLVVGTSAGMGFAVSLFIAALAFTDPDLTASASLGVLAATALAGVATVVAGLVLVPRLPPPAGVLAER